MWMVRPPIAASVSSTKPDSFERVGVDLDLKIVARRRPAGRYRSPRASSPSPRGFSGRCTPVCSCSTIGGARCELPRPRKPKFIGQASAACSILPVLNGPPESMPTVIGPSEPPIMVVMPLASACSTRPALSKCTWTSIAPGVAIMPSQSRTVVAGRTIRRGSTPSMIAGLPALPMPTIRPSRMPRSPLTMPSTGSITSTLHSRKSRAPSALVMPAMPMPSRSVLPPPCRHSSP